MKLDMHCHTLGSDGKNTRDELIADAKKKGLKALFITDHDRVSFDHTDAIRSSGLLTVPSVEISTTNTRGDDKGLHMTYYANNFEQELLDILKNTRDIKRTQINEQIEHLEGKGFYIDREEFFTGIKWEGISMYNIAEYIVSKDENKQLLQKIGCFDLGEKPQSVFYKKCLKRNGELYRKYSIGENENYKPELGDISEMIRGKGVLSIAHPNYTFSRDHIKGFKKLYKELYNPILGISAIEINTKASKKWVNAILEMKAEYGDELQLTFGSDCHRLGHPDDRHGDLGFENRFLDDGIIKQEFLEFREKLSL